MATDNPQDYTSPSAEVAAEPDLADATRKADLVATWNRELAMALQREKGFRVTGREVVALYESEKEEEYQFNILYSNTETLAPALYNTTPRPVVERRFKDQDDLGKIAAEATQRVLEFLIDPGESEYSPFDDLMSASVLEALLPGRGVTWFRYEPKWGDDAKTQVVGETVCGEEVPWERFRHGYAKKWPQVPWVSREHLMTREEVEAQFGKELASQLKYDETSEMSDDDGLDTGRKDDSATKGAKLAQVFEIWDKETRKVLFIAPCYKDGPLDELDDPLQLQAFFPCPRPLQMVQKVSSLVPVALYKTYKSQARELNLITKRINKLVAALKMRGFYDKTIDGMDSVLTADDNILIPADNVAALYGTGSGRLDASIWLVPIEKVVQVVQQLYIARDQIKSTIYEITGIADIMRGASNASETLGAQEIKNQWGTLRLKRAQKRVAQYVRESLRIMAEIAITKFSEDTLSKMTGLPWPTGAQKQTAMDQQQAMAAMGQQPGPDTLAVTTAPSWADILTLLRSDLSRSYRIDIETNSTVDAEATEDKQNITDLINAMAQLMNGFAPLIESGSMPFDAAKAMLLTIVRRFRFGPELEDELKTMQAPQPKPDPKAQALQQKSQMDQQTAQMKLQQDQQRFEMEKQKFQAEQAAGQQDIVMKQQMMQLELQIKQEEATLKRQELGQKAALSSQKHQQDMQTLAANTTANLATAEAKRKAATAPKPKAN